MPSLLRNAAAFLRGRTQSESSDGATPGSRKAGETDFRILAEASGDVIMRAGPDMRVTYASPAAGALFGWSPEEIVGFGPEFLVHPDDVAVISAAVAMKLAGHRDQTEQVRARRKDGTTIWVEVNARIVREPGTGAPDGLVLVIRDITERKEMEQRFAALALIDGLTGLRNRRAFDEALSAEWARTFRENGELSLLLADVDHFKAFNDFYGHQVGDDCLRAVAACLAEIARPGDMVARYGGEEFAVIIPETNLATAEEAAERLRAAVQALRIPHAANAEGGGWVSISVGAATALARVGASVKMPEGLLAAADTALYKAKRLGRNRVEPALLLSSGAGTGRP